MERACTSWDFDDSKYFHITSRARNDFRHSRLSFWKPSPLPDPVADLSLLP